MIYVLNRRAIAGVLIAALAPLAASYQCAWAETPPVATPKQPLTVVVPPDGSMPDAYKAQVTHVNQQTFGTDTNTYTMPGITTNQSQSYQSGPLDLVTTDHDGNLASDNGDTFKAISRLQAGVAVAMAAETPQITSAQNFGMRIGWGNYLNEANGVAASAIGVLCRGCFSYGDRIAVDGAVGAGWSSYKTYDSGNVVAGRAGISWGW